MTDEHERVNGSHLLHEIVNSDNRLVFNVPLNARLQDSFNGWKELVADAYTTMLNAVNHGETKYKGMWSVGYRPYSKEHWLDFNYITITNGYMTIDFERTFVNATWGRMAHIIKETMHEPY